jgi:hypothetical protein
MRVLFEHCDVLCVAVHCIYGTNKGLEYIIQGIVISKRFVQLCDCD